MEVVVVLAIVSVVTSIVGIRLSKSLALWELEHAAQGLAADIRWTQQLASNCIADSPLPMISYHTTGYSINAGLDNRLKPSVKFPASVELIAPVTQMAFSLTGKPVLGSTIGLRLKAWPTVCRYVIVLATTGRVRVVSSL